MPEVVLTDNMTSVSNRRDASGKPIMNATYDAFLKACGFTYKNKKVASLNFASAPILPKIKPFE